MNLSRAKTILIFAFLGLNLFLCYHLCGGAIRESTRLRVSGKEWRHVEEQLAENGYTLETKVDRIARKSTFVTVSPSTGFEKRVRELYEVAAVSPEGSLPRLYEGAGARLRIFPGEPLQLELAPGVPLASKDGTADEAATAALIEHYLQEQELAPAELCYDYALSAGEKTAFYYRQRYEGRLLFSGYLKAVVVQGRLVELEASLLEPETTLQEREMEVITAARALLRLIELWGPASPERRIVKADLGFYSREYDAEQWEMPPVWRFLFDDGESCLINAFTGNLEPETSN